MITFLFLWHFAGCPDTTVKTRCFCEWIAHDQQVLESNEDFCRRHYKDQTCLKEFIKLDESTYYIKCWKKP